jgi:hypothetical protein
MLSVLFHALIPFPIISQESFVLSEIVSLLCAWCVLPEQHQPTMLQFVASRARGVRLCSPKLRVICPRVACCRVVPAFGFPESFVRSVVTRAERKCSIEENSDEEEALLKKTEVAKLFDTIENGVAGMKELNEVFIVERQAADEVGNQLKEGRSSDD